jgi:hypothetical protein
MGEKNSKITIVNNTPGIRQYIWRNYVSKGKNKDRIEARSSIIRLKPGANAGIDAETWAHLDKAGSPVREDQDEGTIAPLQSHIDKLSKNKLVELIKNLTCIDTARIWMDESTKPQVKTILLARIKQMDHLEDAKPEDLLKKGA